MREKVGFTVRRGLTAWSALCFRRARLVMAGVLLVTAGAGWLAIEKFAMNSDLTRMIRQQAEWRDRFEAFEAKFPVLFKTAFVVVSGDSFSAVEDSAIRLEAHLQARPGQFRDVYSAANDPFFRDHALLFLTPEKLDQALTRLAEAEPLLSAVSQDPSLRGVLAIVETAVSQDVELPAGFTAIVARIAAAAESVAAGKPQRVPWADEFLGSGGDATHYRVIFVKSPPVASDPVPHDTLMKALRQAIADVDIEPGVVVRLTGELPLANEEVRAARDGAGISGGAALGLLLLVLVVFVRSPRVVVATLAMLLIGVVWTSAWAMLAVGSWNSLSIIFLVMFFGLAIDFALHFCLRVQEARRAGEPQPVATAATGTGPALMLCMLTSSVGFLAFVPTDYLALGELGVISAGGMVIALGLSFTFLPAFFGVFGLPAPLAERGGFRGVTLGERLYPARHWVIAGVLLLMVLALWVATQNLRFDFSVMAIKDPKSESVVTLRELQDAGEITDYTINLLAPDQASAAALRERLEALPVVAKVRTPSSYLPAGQADKLFAVGDAADLLFEVLEPGPVRPAPDQMERFAAVGSLEAALAARQRVDAATPTLGRLRQALGAIDEPRSGVLEDVVVTDLVDEVAWLRRALTVGAVGLADLPGRLRERLLAADGANLLTVLPARDIADVSNLADFINAVQAVVPEATGRPVLEARVGEIVVTAFLTAMALALALISILLWLSLGSLLDVLLVLTPLLIAVLFGIATGALFGISLNMANIIVLPLIFGLGVDNGVHVVHRFRGPNNLDELLHSSTPRAVVLSSLTTAATFAALILSPHAGTASIGALLTISIGWLLVATVVILPLLLGLVGERAAKPA